MAASSRVPTKYRIAFWIARKLGYVMTIHKDNIHGKKVHVEIWR